MCDCASLASLFICMLVSDFAPQISASSSLQVEEEKCNVAFLFTVYVRVHACARAHAYAYNVLFR